MCSRAISSLGTQLSCSPHSVPHQPSCWSSNSHQLPPQGFHTGFLYLRQSSPKHTQASPPALLDLCLKATLSLWGSCCLQLQPLPIQLFFSAALTTIWPTVSFSYLSIVYLSFLEWKLRTAGGFNCFAYYCSQYMAGSWQIFAEWKNEWICPWSPFLGVGEGGGKHRLQQEKKYRNLIRKLHTYLAQRTQCVCRYKEYKKRWRNMFHTLIDLSSEAVARNWPSAEKSTLRTGAVWALNSEDFPLLEMNSL